MIFVCVAPELAILMDSQEESWFDWDEHDDKVRRLEALDLLIFATSQPIDMPVYAFQMTLEGL